MIKEEDVQDLAKQFLVLKKKREEIEKKYISKQAAVDSARERYNIILGELANFNIASLTELQTEIENMYQAIVKDMAGMQEVFKQIEEKEREIYGKEASIPQFS